MNKKEKLVFATKLKTTKKVHENGVNTDIYFGEPVKKEKNKLEFNMPSKKKKEDNQITFNAPSKKKNNIF